MLSNTHEGTQAHDWMNQQGISYFVVNYRLPNGDRSIPIGDVEKGIRTVRDSADVWNINPNDLGIMGFSAGGHLASVISTLSDFDVRPNFSILFYPVISMDVPKSHKWSCINFLGEEDRRYAAAEETRHQEGYLSLQRGPCCALQSAASVRLYRRGPDL